MASRGTPFNHPPAESSSSVPPFAVDSRAEASWSFPAPADHHDGRLANPPAFVRSPDPATVYPVIDTSSNSAILHATGGNLGRFVHSQCDEELFNTEYLRSNKASGHKNLRCFPHCCGGHNPKSFCGAGLVVECAVSNVQIALGRFEEVLKSPHATSTHSPEQASAKGTPNLQQHPDFPTSNNQLQHDLDAGSSLDGYDVQTPSQRIIIPGRRYARHDLFRELKSSENPFGMWFKGTAVASHAADASGRPRFHLNGNRASWHYAWQSSRLNCKNLHAFRVYFFQPVTGDSDTLECVGTVSSPPFRISSSRKARKTFKTSPSMQSLGDSVSGDDQLPMPQASPRAAGGDDDGFSVDSFDGSSSAMAAPMATSTLPLPTLRSQSAYNLGFGFSFPVTTGEMLPSLSSRLSRAATTTMVPPPTMESFGAQHYRGQPDRKRLTRSSSLQSDYYSSSFVSNRQPRARTFPGEETKVSTATTPSRPRGGVMSMDSILNSPPLTSSSSSSSPPLPYTFPVQPDFRPSVPTISVPPLTRNPYHASVVTTPVADMMQLQLSTPRGLPRSLAASFENATQSAFRAPRSPSSVNETPRPKRKRNRSADSSRGSDNQVDRSSWHDGPLMEEIAPAGDWDLVAQAHALGVVVAVVSRLQPVHDANTSVSYRAMWKDPTTRRAAVARISPETNPALARMCGVLVAVSSQLIQRSSFLADVRTRMHTEVLGFSTSEQPQPQPHREEEGRCRHLVALAETMIAFVIPRVEVEIAKVHPRQSSPSPLVDLIRSVQHELVREQWWRDVTLFDDDDDEYPFMEFFKGYYEAIKASVRHEPVSSSAIPYDGERTLSGEWRLIQGPVNELDTSHAVATLGWSPCSWLHRQLALYELETYHIVETATQLTLTLANSLVSSASPFAATLNQHEPTIHVPVDHFPFAPTRRHLLLAHRAWRESLGSTVALRTMQWPTETSCRRAGDGDGTAGRWELLRTRLTTYFSVASSTAMHVRFVIEGSVTTDAKLCAMAFAPPNDADMAEYFDAPAAWETLYESTLTYERCGYPKMRLR